MVTTRRRITSEQDRFGGYSIQPANKSVLNENETETPSVEMERSFSFRTVKDEPYFGNENATKYAVDDKAIFNEHDGRVAVEQPPVIEYSSRPYYGAYEYSKPVMAPARAKKTRKREKEDVMPSIRTRAYASEEQGEQPKTREKSGMASKTKVALVAYIAVVLVLAVLVIATGLAVSNINAQSARLENEIAIKNNRLTELNAEIKEYTNLDRITGAAVNNGMEHIGNVTEVELVPTNPPTNYEGKTNWFDKLSDFLSNIVGG